MRNDKYRPRLIDKKIDEYLKAFGAVCVEGAKWCGKTWTSAVHAESQILIGNPENSLPKCRPNSYSAVKLPDL